MIKLKLAPIAAATFLVLNACNTGTNDASKEEAIGNEAPGQPVETREQDAGYEPAFSGQMRAPGVTTTASYEVRVLTDQLSKPWGITTLPDGRFLITEKEGNMRIVSQEGQVSDKITGLPEVDAKGQGGLLGLTLDPEFASNKTVYWAFTEKRDKGNLTSVAKGMLSADDTRIEKATVIYRATPAYDGDKHFGGRVIFDKEGNLYLTTGERSDKETRPQSQDLNSGLGVCRIKL
ncbi:PQQ-dependent sugar dehydrogenase [Pontibacter qinzhouensis]|uniref:PQQ-dependent sugar dehydrogenase n=1 Tax=Pontibacter qinzhouensis TaxID=2603253 RepID=A0A5C8IYP9_9BACT|nr:PQQ-dependent sugar dehydrogenase [Pontibacter qinzhouensis]TXK26420.1 PQQ-dependent sugar dehydrogenase [Pontibacter qinzhouensis]